MKLFSEETLEHFGIKGQKWGYNKGLKNGKRIAEIEKEERELEED